MPGQVLGRGRKIVGLVEYLVVGDQAAQVLLDGAEVDGNARLVQFQGAQMDLQLKGMPVHFFTFALVILQEVGRGEFLRDAQFPAHVFPSLRRRSTSGSSRPSSAKARARMSQDGQRPQGTSLPR